MPASSFRQTPKVFETVYSLQMKKERMPVQHGPAPVSWVSIATCLFVLCISSSTWGAGRSREVWGLVWFEERGVACGTSFLRKEPASLSWALGPAASCHFLDKRKRKKGEERITLSRRPRGEAEI